MSQKLTIESALRGEHDEYLNQKLCEWLGWKQCDPSLFKTDLFYLRGHGFRTRAQLPDHINGESALGHCHEAEKRLSLYQKMQYAEKLYRLPDIGTLRDCEDETDFETVFQLIHADGRQRTVALLLTVRPEIFE